MKFLNWIKDGIGCLVVGGTLLEELNRTSVREWARQALSAGLIRSVKGGVSGPRDGEGLGALMTTQFGPVAGSATRPGGIPAEIDERTWPVEMICRGNPQATRIPTPSGKISDFPTFHKPDDYATSGAAKAASQNTQSPTPDYSTSKWQQAEPAHGLGIVPRYAISRYFSAVRQARKLPCISLGWAHPTSAMSRPCGRSFDAFDPIAA